MGILVTYELFLTEKSWFFFIFIFDKANAIPTLFGTIFTITIKFVHLMIDLFLRFDPLSPSSWSGLYFNFQADFG